MTTKTMKGKKSNKNNFDNLQMNLFELTKNDRKESKEEMNKFNSMKNTLNTVKVDKTTENINIEKKLDCLLTRENLPTKKSERYKCNVDALSTLNYINKNGRIATEKEQKVLSKYVGWGGLSEKFDSEVDQVKLKTLLKDNYDSAKSSVLTSFYTPSFIIKFIYRVLDRFGFEKGRILEPSVGTGRFLAYMPENMYIQSKITCVEKDNVSAQITKQLFQSANVIHSPYENVELEDESFDLIISNIPFNDIPVYGKTDKELNDLKLKIHDYYFAKSIKKLRPGGLMVFITSTGTMDKKNDSLRKLISKKCNLLGAVRLPKGAFCDTEVSTDILFLQKLDIGVSTNEWTELKELNGVTMNEYYVNNPEMLLGEVQTISGQFGPVDVLINKDFGTKTLENFHTKLPDFIYTTPLDDSYMYKEEEIILIPANKDYMEGEFVIYEKQLYQVQQKKLVPYSIADSKKPMVIDYINLKECIKNIIKIQVEKCTDEELKMKQSELNTLYDKFFKRYGLINSKNNKKLLDKDVRYPLVASLEIYDVETDKHEKASIFTTRTIGISNNLKEVTTVDDAFALSMCNNGYLNLEYMARALKRPLISIIVEALEKDLMCIYAEDTNCVYNPSLVQYVTKGEFVSGYVKDKLKNVKNILRELNNIPLTELSSFQKFLLKYFKISESLLEANQPEYVTDVYFELQSAWIPNKIKEEFVNGILRTKSTRVHYTEATGYFIETKEYIQHYIRNTEFGTNRVDVIAILKAILNMTDIVVKDKVNENGKDKYIKNVKETQLANAKKEEIGLAFNEFISNNPNTLKEILDLYNDKFINYVDRKYTNILYNLQINPEVKPRLHQLEGASRIITSPNNTLLFHSVGSGKTYTMIIAAHEMHRISKMGGKLGSKNLFIIPNHLCMSGQFAKDYLTIYPQARILATTPNDFSKANRRRLLSKIMTSDWEAVIIPYSQLATIELKPETEAKLLYEDLRDIEDTLYYLKNESVMSTKRIEKMRLNILTKLEALKDMYRDTCGIYWEDLGIDNIFIDEAHNFKNLYFKTKLNVPGVGGTSAKKTMDLYNKIRYHREVHGEKGIVFATATPLSNSMSEVYTMMKYLCEGVLHRYGFNCFDQWASTFGKVVTNMEVNPTGKGFRFRSSFSKFNNVPELMQLFRQVADIVNIHDIDDIKLPKIKNGEPQNITVSPTHEMIIYIEDLVERAKRISEGKVEPTEDNMLMVANDGRKLAVCPYLVGVDGESPKINAVADHLADAYFNYPDKTHMVFCDLGTPKKNSKTIIKKEIAMDIEANEDEEEKEIDINSILDQYSFNSSHNVYEELKNKLTNRGVDPEDVIFIHDYEKPEKKKAILDEFNEGKKKILIGSSPKLSEGVNCQKKLKTLHHICAPWKPSVIEQREGRIVRQGNDNEEVEIYRYIVNNSFDAYSWQILERKATYISQIISGTSSQRSMEDIELQVMNYTQAKACACGDARIMDLFQNKNDLQKLQLLEKSYKDKKVEMLNAIAYHKKIIERNNSKIKNITMDLRIASENTSSDKHELVLGGKQYNKDNIGEAVDALKLLLTSNKEGVLGYIHNLPIRLQFVTVGFNDVTRSITVGENFKYDLGFKSYAKVMYDDIINYVDYATRSIKSSEMTIEENSKEIDGLNANIDKPFAHAEELKELKLKVAKLEKELSIGESAA